MHLRVSFSLFVFLLCACGSTRHAPPGESYEPWVEEDFIEGPPAKPTASTENPLSETNPRTSEETAPATPSTAAPAVPPSTSVSFFQSYPDAPDLPPPIRDRRDYFDPDREHPPSYGTIPRLRTVPKSGREPFPQDYVGVERWNRSKSLPQGPLNPPPEAFYTPLGADASVMERTSRLFSVNPRIRLLKGGVQGTFAMNFLENLRGGAFSAGFAGLYLHNKVMTLEGWTGFRRVTVGVTGEAREVYTFDNWGTGLSWNVIPYLEGKRHLRFGLGVEFDFNFETTRSQAGGTDDVFSNVHFVATTAAATWHWGKWALFAKYLLIPHQLVDDHADMIHIADFGVTVYLL